MVKAESVRDPAGRIDYARMLYESGDVVAALDRLQEVGQAAWKRRDERPLESVRDHVKTVALVVPVSEHPVSNWPG